MKAFLVAASLLVSTSAFAADYALMVNDAERNALLELIDAGVRARGLDLAANAAVLANKIKNAPRVTEQKADPPPAPPEKPKDK